MSYKQLETKFINVVLRANKDEVFFETYLDELCLGLGK